MDEFHGMHSVIRRKVNDIAKELITTWKRSIVHNVKSNDGESNTATAVETMEQVLMQAANEITKHDPQDDALQYVYGHR